MTALVAQNMNLRDEEENKNKSDLSPKETLPTNDTPIDAKDIISEVSRIRPTDDELTELESILNKKKPIEKPPIEETNEPIENKNHAIDAVRCADQMLKKVKTLQTKWLDEGKPKIDIGIGISTGEAFVGNIGSEDRFEYTVIGDTVNTASRIENYNKIYKTKFLISQSTFEIVQKHVDVIKIREVSIRGKSKKINIYEVLRIIDH
jgi:class 3 adenylate cyclase